MKPYFCEDFLDRRLNPPVFLHDKKPSDMCSLSGKMILHSMVSEVMWGVFWPLKEFIFWSLSVERMGLEKELRT
jgi:hypothetical protein